ncbi:MAG: aldehyde ferredoxin oxidoreductase [Deltaproteobacteria bacterium]|nr:aldehyde ferredoxin oxidoreductase [Deltaproteobacteria bacterium]
MDYILRVNMTDLSVKKENVPDKYASLGGRGLTSHIVLDEVDALANPIGPNNKLVFAPGLLGATSAPTSGRMSVGGKSPLTGGIKEANAGGQAGQYLSRLRVKAIILEGTAPTGKMYKLVLSKDQATLKEANDLMGLANYDTVAKLTAEYGEKSAYITIGQAGEMLLKAASIAVTDQENRPTRHAGRGGLGAVMGSKGLKAIVVDPTGTDRADLADPEAFKTAQRKFLDTLNKHPVTSSGLPTYGTNVLTNILNEAGGLPTRNFSSGRFEHAEAISGEKFHEIITARGGKPTHGCHSGCTIRCSGVYLDKDGHYLTKEPEYETVWANGANCGISDPDSIAMLDRLYDDIGLDSIELGNSLAVAMDGGLLPFGDAEGAIKLIKEVGQGTVLGKVLGSGAAVTGAVFGVKRIPVTKGQALPAYDPRAVKGIGVTYATSTMGGDHTAGYATTANILSVGGSINPLKSEGQVELSRNLQIATAALDSTGLCLFTAFPILDMPEAFEAVYEMINAKYGLTLTGNDVVELGKTILRAERKFNELAGFSKQHDRLPEFFKTDPLPPHNTVFDVPDIELDTVFNF